MDCDQSQLKDIVRSALGEMLESKLASLLGKKLEPLYLTLINKFHKQGIQGHEEREKCGFDKRK